MNLQSFTLLSLSLFSVSPLAHATCAVVKATEEYNAFRIWVGLVTKARYEMVAAPCIEIDVTDYMQGGEAVEGAVPANFIAIQVDEGEDRIEVRRDLSSEERVVRISFEDAAVITGKKFEALKIGQRVMIVIGTHGPNGFNAISMSGGVVGGEG